MSLAFFDMHHALGRIDHNLLSVGDPVFEPRSVLDPVKATPQRHGVAPAE
jgi:hypothetical protein